MARPTSWHTKIRGPQEALDFYAALVRAIDSGAFSECHVFNGARSQRGVPLFSADAGTNTQSAGMAVGKYLGLEVRRKTCTTDGCLNPLHYQRADDIPINKRKGKEHIPVPQTPQRQDLIDLIEFYRHSKNLHGPMTRDEYRKLIPEEDLHDGDLDMAMSVIPHIWKKE